MRWDRAIIHADMDAFFASIEQMDDPALRGKPVGVTNGLTGTCIITCSYEARASGVKTTMHLKKARAVCPELIRRPARPQRYVQVSTAIMHCLQAITPEIEIFSVDEAFLDITASQSLFGCPERIAREVKQAIHEHSGVTASVGLSDSKLVAKWAAKHHKPDGFSVVGPGAAAKQLERVPVKEICGINEGIARYLALHGATTCGQVARLPMRVLSQRWGPIGKRLHMTCAGYDPEPIIREVPAPKTVGHGKVMPPDTRDRGVIEIYFLHMCSKVAARLRRHQYQAGRYFVGLRTVYGWCSSEYRIQPTDDASGIFHLCMQLLDEEWNGLGGFQVQVTALNPVPSALQVDIFHKQDPRRMKLNRAVDDINRRYGEWAIAPARLIKRSDMPNVIAPSWKPFGHRETIQAGKYENPGARRRRSIRHGGSI